MERVHELEQSRDHVVDDAAARLRRIERDLHDGPRPRWSRSRWGWPGPGEAAARSPEPAGGTDRTLDWSSGPPRGKGGHRRTARHRPRHPPPVAGPRAGSRARHPRRAQWPAGSSWRLDLPERSSAAIETIAYFCAAELLANVAKHAAPGGPAGGACAEQGLVRLRGPRRGSGGARVGPVAGWPGWPTGPRRGRPPAERRARAGGPTVVTVDCPAGPDRDAVAIAEDSAVLRDGPGRVLADRGFEVAAAVGRRRRLLGRGRAPSRRRRGRHPDAAGLHRRGPARGAHEPPRPPGSGFCSSPSTSRPVTPPTCWRRRCRRRRVPAEGPGGRRRATSSKR